ncbi:hypothetical protein LT335_00717 [Spiroplasma sp. JKS002669]|uniref:hypothetical protein n=1 Tax=Spiroplasma attinicola TaxID=2904537 RepID=UPI0020BE49C3|nr:hypothetical protein [Spiroplasma sp. JKS002669]MCL6429155.1 hypothetical protein [Spiroplasma sp. JKS002669]
MNSNLIEIKKEIWNKFLILQQEIFLVSYKEFLDVFVEKLDHTYNEITSILFLKCYIENFDSILNNVNKTQTEIIQDIEDNKQIIINSKNNIEILNLSKNFVKNIKKLNISFQRLILTAFFIISFSFIKDVAEQEKLMNEFTSKELNSVLNEKKSKKQLYNFLEKAWKENINKIYDEIVEFENEKTRSELEKTIFISFNFFNNGFK